jgi:hypothetical protein
VARQDGLDAVDDRGLRIVVELVVGGSALTLVIHPRVDGHREPDEDGPERFERGLVPAS